MDVMGSGNFGKLFAFDSTFCEKGAKLHSFQRREPLGVSEYPRVQVRARCERVEEGSAESVPERKQWFPLPYDVERGSVHRQVY